MLAQAPGSERPTGMATSAWSGRAGLAGGTWAGLVLARVVSLDPGCRHRGLIDSERFRGVAFSWSLSPQKPLD